MIWIAIGLVIAGLVVWLARQKPSVHDPDDCDKCHDVEK